MTGMRHPLRVAVAITASFGVHFAAAMVAAPSSAPILIEGGAMPEIATLGSNFEDLLQGSDRLQPSGSEPVEAVSSSAAEVQPVPRPPETPLAVTPTALATQAQPVKVAAAEPAVVRAALPAETVPDVHAPAPTEPATGPLMAVTSPASVEELQPRQATPPPVAESSPSVPPAATDSTKVAAITPAQVVETVDTEAVDRPVPVPLARPPRPEDARAVVQQRTEPKKQANEQRQVAEVARGNSDRNARAGQTTGRETAKTKTGGGQEGGRSNVAGNAAASNYPGKVYARIRRTRQQTAGGQGVARVRFSIAGNGALVSIRLARSSGSEAIDAVALDHVRRSAPFPAPPPGAQRHFVIPIEVRR